MSNKNIKSSLTYDNSLNPEANYNDNVKIQETFDGSCLKQEKVTLACKPKVNIVYEINLWPYEKGVLIWC